MIEHLHRPQWKQPDVSVSSWRPLLVWAPLSGRLKTKRPFLIGKKCFSICARNRDKIKLKLSMKSELFVTSRTICVIRPLCSQICAKLSLQGLWRERVSIKEPTLIWIALESRISLWNPSFALGTSQWLMLRFRIRSIHSLRNYRLKKDLNFPKEKAVLHKLGNQFWVLQAWTRSPLRTFQ